MKEIEIVAEDGTVLAKGRGVARAVADYIDLCRFNRGTLPMEEFEEFRKYPQMPFIVAQKSDPFYVQPFMVDDSSLEYAYDDYLRICKECQEWIDGGRKATGIKPTKRVKIWRN